MNPETDHSLGILEQMAKNFLETLILIKYFFFKKEVARNERIL